MSNKNLSLESLRGMAALAVAILHFPSVSPLYNNHFILNAIWMVDFFFVLSGYVIALNYAHRLNNWSELITFQTKRFWRLYPLHLVTLLLFLVIELAKLLFESYVGIQANNAPFERNNLPAFLNNLFLTHSIFMNWFTFNQPSWSISTEFYAYAMFAVLMVMTRKYSVIIFFMIITGACYLLYFAPNVLEHTTLRPFMRCLYSFFIGVLVWRMTRLVPVKTDSIPSGTFLVIAILAVMYIPDYGRPIVPFLFGIVIYCFSGIQNDCVLNRLLCHRILVYLGTISYSVYMMHSAIWWIISQILRFVFHVDTRIDNMGHTAIDLDKQTATIITLLGISLILLVSHFTFRCIEDRFRRGL